MSRGAGIIDTPTVAKVKKSDSEWKASLSASEYAVLRRKDTEEPEIGEYVKTKTKGIYVCRACGNPLYTFQAKFDSGCGWPAFDRHIPGAIKAETDISYGMERVEIMCGACDGHLGHIFTGEQFTETNTRHCVNSVSVRLIKDVTLEELLKQRADEKDRSGTTS